MGNASTETLSTFASFRSHVIEQPGFASLALHEVRRELGSEIGATRTGDMYGDFAKTVYEEASRLIRREEAWAEVILPPEVVALAAAHAESLLAKRADIAATVGISDRHALYFERANQLHALAAMMITPEMWDTGGVIPKAGAT